MPDHLTVLTHLPIHISPNQSFQHLHPYRPRHHPLQILPNMQYPPPTLRLKM